MLSPKISLLLVTRDCEAKIHKSLESYRRLNFDLKTVELIIIDGCSIDNTLKIIHKFKEKYSNLFHSIQILNNPKKYLATGWNIGVKSSRGDFIMRIDAHSEINPDYLKIAYDYLLLNIEVQAVGGGLESKSTDESYGISNLVGSKFGTGGSPFRGGKSKTPFYSDTAVFALYRSSLFERIGLFNEDLDRGQDIEFHSRALKLGFLLATNPSMKIDHYPETNFKKFHKKAFNTAFWAVKGGNARLRHLVPMFFVIYLSILVFNTLLNYIPVLISLIPMALYLFLLLYFSVKDKLYFQGYLFFTYHIIYGLGSLKALPSVFRKWL